MMDNYINIIYIDDQWDINFHNYLERFCKENQGYNLIYERIKYDPTGEYESLLYMDKVKKADIILLDEKLFQENSKIRNKISGAKAKLFMQIIYPYKRVILITQDEEVSFNSKILKFNKRRDGETYPGEDGYIHYYEEKIKHNLLSLCAEICDVKKLISELKESNEPPINNEIKDAVLFMADSDSDVKMPTKNDVESLVEEVKKLIEKL